MSGRSPRDRLDRFGACRTDSNHFERLIPAKKLSQTLTSWSFVVDHTDADALRQSHRTR